MHSEHIKRNMKKTTWWFVEMHLSFAKSTKQQQNIMDLFVYFVVRYLIAVSTLSSNSKNYGL